MRHMDLVSMAMPSIGAWGLADLLIIFAMWAIMMIAMMVPSVTPMLLTFATINRTRHAKGRVFVSVWVFLAGYVALWTGFSFVATLAQWGERQKVGGQAALRSGSCVCGCDLNFGYQRRNRSSRSSLRTLVLVCSKR